MTRIVILYALALAAGALALQWLQYQYFARVFTIEIYIALIAIAFAALGVWAGMRLTARAAPTNFERNVAALAALGVTLRELQVLEHLAAGNANKENAVSRAFYEKLGFAVFGGNQDHNWLTRRTATP